MIRTLILSLFAALIMVGCESNINETGYVPDDTDTPATEITVTVKAMLDGVTVEKQPVSLEDTADILVEGLTGEPMTVALRGIAHAWVGAVESDLTADGHRIHTVGDADYVHRTATVTTDTGSDPVEISLNRYIYGTDVDCDHYRNGDYCETYGNGMVETENGHQLFLPDTIGEDSWFEFEGNDVTFVGGMPDAGAELTYFEVYTDRFEFAYESGDSERSFVCHL